MWIKKAVRFYEMAADMAYDQLFYDYVAYDAIGIGGYNDRDLKEMRETCDRLIQIYQNGIPGIAPSQEKVKYYTDYLKIIKRNGKRILRSVRSG